MIISAGRNYIFVHIPKTGGTSLALALEARAQKDDIMMGDTPKALKRRRRIKDAPSAGRLWKHSTLGDIEGLVSAQLIEQAFTFALVRNPWNRMVSYYHWLQLQHFAHQAVSLAKTLSFQEFLSDRFIAQSFRKAPYTSYLTFHGQERASCYIRLEEFEKDAEPLFDHLGFRLELPHENASQRGADYREYYDAASADRLAEICAEDIARFGYSF